ncbi:hypothetical protein ADUPG1_003823, partial [Aduncisulcus paluster]
MDKKAVDQTLLDTVKEEIELVRPVGADVQVLSGVDRQIDVTVDIHKQSGHDILVIQSLIENVIRSYLRLIAFDIDYVSAGQIGKLLLDVEGVLDYDGLMLNGSKSNFALGAYETPVLGTVTSMGTEMDAVYTDLDIVGAQLFVTTATWGLKHWENFL